MTTFIPGADHVEVPYDKSPFCPQCLNLLIDGRGGVTERATAGRSPRADKPSQEWRKVMPIQTERGGHPTAGSWPPP
jgi:hypothetical protein